MSALTNFLAPMRAEIANGPGPNWEESYNRLARSNAALVAVCEALEYAKMGWQAAAQGRVVRDLDERESALTTILEANSWG